MAAHSLLSVCTAVAGLDGKEGRQTPGTEYLHGAALQVIRMAIPIDREADPGPSPSPHEIYPTLNRPSHYWSGHWCIWLVRKLWRSPSVLAFGWIFISFMGFFCPKESFTLMWNNARSGLFGNFSRKLSSLSLILISCCRKSGITARKSVKLSLWKLMYETRGLWSPPAMEMNSLPESPPSGCKYCWYFKTFRCGSEPYMLEYCAQALESGSSQGFTDQVEGDIRTSREIILWVRLRPDKYK